MTSIVNELILYAIALMTLYPFAVRPHTTVLSLLGALGFAFHLLPMKRLGTSIWIALVIAVTFYQTDFLPFTSMYLYTLSYDLWIDSAHPDPSRVPMRVHQIAATSLVLLALSFLILQTLPTSPSIIALLLMALALWLSYITATRFLVGEERDQLLEGVSSMEVRQDRNRKAIDQERIETIRRTRLEERERIAHDMHDAIGHSLTSSLLQTAVIRTLNRDEALAPLIDELHQTLDHGMTNTRQQLHQLEETSGDIQMELERIAVAYRFAPIELHVRAFGPMPMAILHAMLASTRECLTNISKHSGATEVRIEVREFPSFYRLTIHDNGRGIPEAQLRAMMDGTSTSGMGLRSLRARCEAAQGHFVLTNDDGLKVVMTFQNPKEISS